MNLLKKEEHGIQKRFEFLENFINIFMEAIVKYFGNTVVLEDITYDLISTGSFRIIYKYLPLEYFIIIENEMLLFTIHIEDNKGAWNNLYAIEKFDNKLNGENIIAAIELLHSIFSESEIPMYIDGNI